MMLPEATDAPNEVLTILTRNAGSATRHTAIGSLSEPSTVGRSERPEVSHTAIALLAGDPGYGTPTAFDLLNRVPLTSLRTGCFPEVDGATVAFGSGPLRA